MVADATLEFLRDLSDPAKWRRGRRPLPVFKPHHQPDPSSGEPYDVTADDLKDIAAKMKRLQAEGTPARLTVGHVRPEPLYPEKLQPKVIGAWLDPHVGTFGKEKEPCILAWPTVRMDCLEDAKGRPYRSAEYYHPRRKITGIALLSRDAALNLGTADLADLLEQKEKPDFYQLPGEIDMAEEVKKEPEKKEEEGGEHEAWAKEHGPHLEAYMSKLPHINYAKQCYEASIAGAGEEQGKPPVTAPEVHAAVVKPTLSQSVAVPDLYQDPRFIALQKQVSDLTTTNDRKDCESLIRSLAGEGYAIDSADQATLYQATPKAREAFAGTLRKYGTKTAPQTQRDWVEVAPAPVLYQAGKEDAENGVITEAHSDRAIAYSRKHSCSFDEAVKKTA